MILFVSAASLMMAYGVAYALFCIKKGGVTAALSVFALWLADLCLLGLLIYFRIHT